MIDLTTDYLGLTLKNPLVPSSSPLCKQLDTVLRLEDAGAAAIVLHSFYEEELIAEDAMAERFLLHAELHDGDARIVVRLSGTGTRGATIRLYLEQVGSGTPRVTDDVQSQLASVIAVALTVTNIATHTGRPAPSVIT